MGSELILGITLIDVLAFGVGCLIGHLLIKWSIG